MGKIVGLLWPVVVSSVLLVALAEGGVLAASTFSATNAKSSCVFSVDAQSGGFTYVNGSTYVHRWKCHYDGPSLPSGLSAWFDGDSGAIAGISGDSYLWNASAAGTMETAAASGSTGFVWSNLVVDHFDTALDYVEFHLDVKRWSGTTKTEVYTSNQQKIFRFDASGSTPWEYGNGVAAGDNEGGQAVSAASFASTDTTYYYGAQAWQLLLPFCHGTTVALASPTDLDDLIVTGDTVHITADGGTVAGTEIQVKMPNGGTTLSDAEDWHTVRDATYAGADPQSYSFVTGRMSSAKRARFLQVRCKEPGESWVQRLVTDTVEGTVGDDPLDRPCKSIDLYAPEQESVETGDSLDWVLRYSRDVIGDPTILELELRQGWVTAPSESASYGTWTSIDTNIEPPASETYVVVSTVTGDVDNYFHWRCTDSEGVWYIKHASIIGGGFPGVGIAPDDSAAGCLENSKFGLYPTTWVPGLLRTGQCMVIALVTPTDEALEELSESTGELAEKAPISYVAELGPDFINLFDSTPAAVTANRNDCLPILPGGLAEGVEVNACPAALDSGGMSTFRSIIGVAAWVTFGWMLWNMTMKLVRK